ncbi:MAG: TonB-dependent receptor plug domain-containing protein [Chitinophagales bacterium]|nr:TonB-dependent receptor plug domain-containing protein [Chitinophagales bacterium]
MQNINWLIGLLFMSATWVSANPQDSIAYSIELDTLVVKKTLSAENSSKSTVGDVLKSEPGVFVRTSTLGGVQSVSAQGLTSQYVQVLWNDVPVSSGMLGVADLSLFSIGYRQEVNYSIQGQEFVTGGLAGIVNIKDGSGSDNDNLLRFKQSIGSFGLLSSGIYYEGMKKRHSWSIMVNYEKAKNNFSYTDYTVFPNVKRNQQHGAYYKWNIYPQWSMTLKNGSHLYWYQEILSIHREIPPYLVSPNNLLNQDDMVARQMLKWSMKKNKVEHLFSGMYLYQNLYYKDFVLNRERDNKENQGFLRYQGEVNVHPKWKFSYGNDIKLTAVNTKNYQSGVKEWAWDAFVSTTFSPNKNSQIKALLKTSHRSQLQWVLPFFIEANTFKGKNQNWKIWGRIGKDARFPTLNDRYWAPGGKEDLKTETSINVSTGVSFRHVIKEKWEWNHQIDFFANKISNMILWLPTNRGYFQPQNEGKVFAYGFNVGQSINWLSGFHKIIFKADYSFNRSGNIEKKQNNDKTQWVQLPYYPIHSGKLAMIYNWKNLTFDIDGQSYSQRFVTRDAGVYIPAYTILNASIAYLQKIKKIELEGRMTFHNILNSNYEEVKYRPMPGTNYLFTLLITWKHEKK